VTQDSSALFWRQQLWWHPLFIIITNARSPRALRILSKTQATFQFSHTNPQPLESVVYFFPPEPLFASFGNPLSGIPGPKMTLRSQYIYILKFYPSVVAYMAVFSSPQYYYSQPATIVTVRCHGCPDYFISRYRRYYRLSWLRYFQESSHLVAAAS
jgi:hypothetical protein